MVSRVGVKVLGVTLARGGSVAIKDKNIRSVGGKPMIVWTLDEVKKCKTIDHYVVSTDSAKIAGVVDAQGAQVLNRPEELAQNDTPAIDALIHALDTIETATGEQFDIVADIRVTNPMKLADDIDGCVRKLMSSGADVVCGISQLDDHHPSRIKYLVGDRLADVWPEPSGNRQDLTPTCYIRNGSIYACRASALREGIHFSGGDIRGYVMPSERGINVDSELDLLVCNALLST